MYWGQSFRNQAFWIKDSLNGGLIKNHLNDIEQAYQNPAHHSTIHEIRLNDILKFATTTSPYYRQYKKINNLADFPVITKNDLKDHYEELFSVKYDRSNLLGRTTSGSYGIPFHYYVTPDKFARRMAELIYFNRWAGYKIGMRYTQIRPKQFTKWQQVSKNLVPMDPTHVNDEWKETQRQKLKAKKIQFIISYPTPLLEIAEWCQRQGDTPKDFHLKGIISSGETLTERARNAFKNVFGCTVLNRYATEELGVVAHENPRQGNYTINFTSHHIEILDMNKDVPVDPGVPGRIVITDLFSHAMPLIRYEIGDSAEWDVPFNSGSNILSLKTFHGRITEKLFNTDGSYVNYGAIYGAIDKSRELTEGVIQYQIIQETSDTYRIKLQVKPEFNLQDLLISQYKKLFGQNANIILDFVDQIPRLQSGKRAIMINRYKQ